MASVRDTVIVSTARTAMAKSFRGSFNLTRPDDMAAHAVREALKKVPKLDPAEIDDVVMGTGFPRGRRASTSAATSSSSPACRSPCRAPP